MAGAQEVENETLGPHFPPPPSPFPPHPTRAIALSTTLTTVGIFHIAATTRSLFIIDVRTEVFKGHLESEVGKMRCDHCD